MINNLFSIFDPNSSLIFTSNWLRFFIPIIYFNNKIWIIRSRLNKSLEIIISLVTKEITALFSPQNIKNLLIIIRIFLITLFRNTLGIFPYIFTRRSHLIVRISIRLPLWTRFIIFGWISNTSKIFSHLIPSGTPIALSVFIVFIETIRNIIRPITLSVRLTANIIAGHLLLNLLREISETIISLFIPSSCLILTLLILEFSVAIIQSYVFITLSSLYINEIN